jgi:uncharacterized protein YprB with RNaseH-like and TPR domain
MLKNTFIHIPGIGERIERRIWSKGISTWEDYLRNLDSFRIPPHIKDKMKLYLDRSIEALGLGDPRFFEDRLPTSEVWRIYPEFKDRVAFLDIETTGLAPPRSYITTICLYDGKEAMTFVQGINLDDFLEKIERYSLIVTYGGKCFDIPFIESSFPGFKFHQAHIDLAYFLRHLGYTGGLKKVEKMVGLSRENGLDDVDGYFAVVLWQKYRRGDGRALHALIRYNLEDVVNLKGLMEFGYNQAIGRLPISLNPIMLEPRPDLDVPFDPGIIQEIKDELARRRQTAAQRHSLEASVQPSAASNGQERDNQEKGREVAEEKPRADC